MPECPVRLKKRYFCARCGAEMRGRLAKDRKFCSKQCAFKKYRVEPRHCKWCGVEFTPKHTWRLENYCSRACVDKGTAEQRRLPPVVHLKRELESELSRYWRMLQREKVQLGRESPEYKSQQRRLARESERRRYWGDPEHRRKARARRMRYKNTPKDRARWELFVAVKKGEVTRPDLCSRCKQPPEVGVVQGHHADYSKPLQVTWLCSGCHGEETSARYGT